MKPKTYWLTRDEDGWYGLHLSMPRYKQAWNWWVSERREGFCPEEVHRLCPSAKLEPGECIEITGFKIIKKKKGSG